MNFKGFHKVSLIDYPGKICAIVFTGGCNFRCHYCHNPDLVIGYEKLPDIKKNEVLYFMQKRKGLLDGLCISGGEPTIWQELPQFMKKIKELGFLVKLDTNGTNSGMLKEVIEKKLVDYVAMDIKGTPERYPEIVGATLAVVPSPEVSGQSSAGALPLRVPMAIGSEGAQARRVYSPQRVGHTQGVVPHINYVRDLMPCLISKIKESVQILLQDKIDYELRTTVFPEFFTQEDAKQIGEWVKGAKRYVLQKPHTEKTLNGNFKPKNLYSDSELLNLLKFLPNPIMR